MRIINLAEITPKRKYTAYPDYPDLSNGIIDKLIELIELGETFTQTILCVVNERCDCCVSTYPIEDKLTLQLLIDDFEKSYNPIFIDEPELHMQIFRWNNIYYYLTY